jgi:hypothetical protein
LPILSAGQGDQIGRIFRLLGKCLLWAVFEKIGKEVAHIVWAAFYAGESYEFILTLNDTFCGRDFLTTSSGHPGRGSH